MKMPDIIEERMLAACGVLCTACVGHLKKKKPCVGCRGPDEQKRTSCVNCVRKNCADERGLALCALCGDFPCKWIKTLDKSYRTRYGISLIQNGKDAAADLHGFLEAQRAHYLCPHCGGAVCQHDGLCSECGRAVLEKGVRL